MTLETAFSEVVKTGYAEKRLASTLLAEVRNSFPTPQRRRFDADLTPADAHQRASQGAF
jgi:hypothetical protein